MADDDDRKVIHTYSVGEFTSKLYEGEVRIEKDVKRHCARIIISRPEYLNSLTVAGWDYVAKAVKDFDRDDDVKVIVLEGEGEHFGTGGDARDLGMHAGFKDGRRPSQRRRLMPNRETTMGFPSVIETVARSLKATIAKVRGYCYGNSFQVAVAADIVIASEDAMFTHPAWRYMGPLFNYAHLFETIGVRKAKDMLLTCRAIDAKEAEECGLVTKCVPGADLDRWTDDYVAAIAAQPIDGIVMGKQMMEMVLDGRGYGLGTQAALVGHTWMSNLRFEPDEWNFVKRRKEVGLTAALREREEMVAPYFRQSRRKKPQ